jgi:hypothetical protein
MTRPAKPLGGAYVRLVVEPPGAGRTASDFAAPTTRCARCGRVEVPGRREDQPACARCAAAVARGEG